MFIPLLETGIEQFEQETCIRRIGSQNSLSGVNHFYRFVVFVELKNDQVLEPIAFLGANIHAAVRELIHHLVGAKESRGIVGGDIHNRLGHLLLGTRCDLDIDPKANTRKQDCKHEHRNTNARNAHPIGLERNQLVVGGYPSKYEQ